MAAIAGAARPGAAEAADGAAATPRQAPVGAGGEGWGAHAPGAELDMRAERAD